MEGQRAAANERGAQTRVGSGSAPSGAATHVGEATHTAADEEAARTRAAAPEYPSGRKHT